MTTSSSSSTKRNVIWYSWFTWMVKNSLTIWRTSPNHWSKLPVRHAIWAHVGLRTFSLATLNTWSNLVWIVSCWPKEISRVLEKTRDSKTGKMLPRHNNHNKRKKGAVRNLRATRTPVWEVAGPHPNQTATPPPKVYLIDPNTNICSTFGTGSMHNQWWKRKRWPKDINLTSTCTKPRTRDWMSFFRVVLSRTKNFNVETSTYLRMLLTRNWCSQNNKRNQQLKLNKTRAKNTKNLVKFTTSK